MNPTSKSLLLSPGTLLCLLAACADQEAEALSLARSMPQVPVVDRPLEAYRVELLELAFRSASKLPLEPHIKDRARAQAKVVDACFALGQPRRALSYIEQSPNWRRGAGLADYAFHCAQHGAAVEAQKYLDRAERIADELARDANSQAWRRDRILASVARTYLLLGQNAKARQIATGVVESESGRADSVRVELIDAAAFDAQVAALDQVFATGGFDLVQNALQTCAELFDRFYDDVERRAAMEQRIKAAYTKLPINVRVERLIELAGHALAHRGARHALELIDHTHAVLAEGTWLPERQVELAARLAALRHRAGATQLARQEAAAALALFDTRRADIVDIYRAGALRPIAEAYHAMGEAATALAVYKRAVAAGMENPNSRPRAEDLAATCRSLAEQACAPDADLGARLREICAGLGDPW